jgi:flagellar hook capping protein FlgD
VLTPRGSDPRTRIHLQRTTGRVERNTQAQSPKRNAGGGRADRSACGCRPARDPVRRADRDPAVAADVSSRDRLRIEPSVMRASARIEFGAALGSPGRVEVLDALGRTIRALAVEARSTSVVWDGRAGNGRRAADGVYWVRLVSPGRVATGRVAVDR